MISGILLLCHCEPLSMAKGAAIFDKKDRLLRTITRNDKIYSQLFTCHPELVSGSRRYLNGYKILKQVQDDKIFDF